MLGYQKGTGHLGPISSSYLAENIAEHISLLSKMMLRTNQAQCILHGILTGYPDATQGYSTDLANLRAYQLL